MIALFFPLVVPNGRDRKMATEGSALSSQAGSKAMRAGGFDPLCDSQVREKIPNQIQFLLEENGSKEAFKVAANLDSLSITATDNSDAMIVEAGMPPGDPLTPPSNISSRKRNATTPSSTSPALHPQKQPLLQQRPSQQSVNNSRSMNKYAPLSSHSDLEHDGEVDALGDSLTIAGNASPAEDTAWGSLVEDDDEDASFIVYRGRKMYSKAGKAGQPDDSSHDVSSVDSNQEKSKKIQKKDDARSRNVQRHATTPRGIQSPRGTPRSSPARSTATGSPSQGPEVASGGASGDQMSTESAPLVKKFPILPITFSPSKGAPSARSPMENSPADTQDLSASGDLGNFPPLPTRPPTAPIPNGSPPKPTMAASLSTPHAAEKTFSQAAAGIDWIAAIYQDRHEEMKEASKLCPSIFSRQRNGTVPVVATRAQPLYTHPLKIEASAVLISGINPMWTTSMKLHIFKLIQEEMGLMFNDQDMMEMHHERALPTIGGNHISATVLVRLKMAQTRKHVEDTKFNLLDPHPTTRYPYRRTRRLLFTFLTEENTRMIGTTWDSSVHIRGPVGPMESVSLQLQTLEGWLKQKQIPAVIFSTLYVPPIASHGDRTKWDPELIARVLIPASNISPPHTALQMVLGTARVPKPGTTRLEYVNEVPFEIFGKWHLQEQYLLPHQTLREQHPCLFLEGVPEDITYEEILQTLKAHTNALKFVTCIFDGHPGLPAADDKDSTPRREVCVLLPLSHTNIYPVPDMISFGTTNCRIRHSPCSPREYDHIVTTRSILAKLAKKPFEMPPLPQLAPKGQMKDAQYSAQSGNNTDMDVEHSESHPASNNPTEESTLEARSSNSSAAPNVESAGTSLGSVRSTTMPQNRSKAGKISSVNTPVVPTYHSGVAEMEARFARFESKYQDDKAAITSALAMQQQTLLTAITAMQQQTQTLILQFTTQTILLAETVQAIKPSEKIDQLLYTMQSSVPITQTAHPHSMEIVDASTTATKQCSSFEVSPHKDSPEPLLSKHAARSPIVMDTSPYVVSQEASQTISNRGKYVVNDPYKDDQPVTTEDNSEVAVMEMDMELEEETEEDIHQDANDVQASS
jgi:hypothetical protein